MHSNKQNKLSKEKGPKIYFYQKQFIISNSKEKVLFVRCISNLLEQVGSSRSKSKQSAEGLGVNHQRATLVVAAAVTPRVTVTAALTSATVLTVAVAWGGQQIGQETSGAFIRDAPSAPLYKAI
jgi:hypothetical protein